MLFYKIVVYKKVVLPGQSLKKVLVLAWKKFKKIFKSKQLVLTCMKPTHDMTEIENVKIILVQ